MQPYLVLPLDLTEGAGAWPFIIGGCILLVFVSAMLVLLGIGKGREHS